MSVQSVRSFLSQMAPDIKIMELERSTATVQLAAAAHNVEPGQIAKTLSLRVGEETFLVVIRGDARLDNRKSKLAFGGKVRMLGAEEVEAATGHPVGGVCPFGLLVPIPVYCDNSLKTFAEVVLAAGSSHATLRADPLRIVELAKARWVDVCQDRV